MIASLEFMKKFICDNDIDPLLGSREVSPEKFFEWFEEVKDIEIGYTKVKEFDIDSVLIYFNNDLEDFYEMEEKEK